MICTWITDDALEESYPYLAIPKRLMAVDTRAYPFLGVIQVHAAEIVQPNQFLVGLHHSMVSLLRQDVIPCSGRMTGVYTDPDTTLILYGVYDLSDLLKGKAKVGSLTGGVLNHRLHSLCSLKRDIDPLSDLSQTGRDRGLTEIGTRVKVDHTQSQLLAPLHLIRKGMPALLHYLLSGRAKVDQVTSMGQDILRLKATLSHIGLKGFNILLLQRFREPLTLVSGKESKSIGADLLRIEWSILHSTSARDVRAYIFRHYKRLSIKCYFSILKWHTMSLHCGTGEADSTKRVCSVKLDLLGNRIIDNI